MERLWGDKYPRAPVRIRDEATMKISELEKEAKKELETERVDVAKALLKGRLEEIQRTKRILTKLEKKYKDLLGKDVDDVVPF